MIHIKSNRNSINKKEDIYTIDKIYYKNIRIMVGIKMVILFLENVV